MPLLPSALPLKGEARRYVANDFLNLIDFLSRGRCPKGADRVTMAWKTAGIRFPGHSYESCKFPAADGTRNWDDRYFTSPFFTARTLHRMVNNHCRTAGNVLGGSWAAIERDIFYLLAGRKMRKKVFFKNGIHDIMRESWLRKHWLNRYRILFLDFYTERGDRGRE